MVSRPSIVVAAAFAVWLGGTDTALGQTFPIQVDATSLSTPTLHLSGVGTIAPQVAQSFSLVPGVYTFQYLAGVGGVDQPSVIYTVTTGGLFDYDVNLEGIMQGAGTSLLTVNGATIRIAAASSGDATFHLGGVGSLASGDCQSVQLLPGGITVCRT